jgi:hypothetical protein
MRASFNRRTATKVKDGRVQRKNRHRPTGHDGYVLHRESPGRGFRHVVTKRDVQAFIDIIPEWHRFAERLEHIVLVTGNHDWYGLYRFYHREETGAIFLHAWADDLWMEIDTPWFEDHATIFESCGEGIRYVPLHGSAGSRFHALAHLHARAWTSL